MILFLAISLVNTLQAQVFPTSATVRLVPPYNTFLSELSQGNSDKVQVILLQRDQSVPSYDVRLKFKVKLAGNVIFETAPSFVSPIINLEQNTPIVLSGADLSTYFQANNLVFANANLRNIYVNNGQIPEGLYEFCATVYSATRADRQLSNNACQIFSLSRSLPPLLNLPACGGAIPEQNPLNLRFWWTPQHSNSVNSAANTSYVLEIFEIRNADGNANNAVLSSNPVFSFPTPLTQYFYSISDPNFIVGMRYAWRVRVIDESNRDAFINNGYSAVCEFTYAPTLSNGQTLVPILAPANIQAEGKGNRAGRVYWSAFAGAVIDKPDRYKVEYKKVGVGLEWFSEFTTTNELVINQGLEPATTYEARVQGEKGGFLGESSSIVTFTTFTPVVAVCGVTPTNILQNMTPMRNARIGMPIEVTGFEVVLDSLQEESTPGVYSGRGLIKIPFMANQTFTVLFENLFINELGQAGEGKVWFKTKPIEEWIAEQAGQTAANQQEAQDILTNQQTFADTPFHDDVITFGQVGIQGIEQNPQGHFTMTTTNGTDFLVDTTLVPKPPRKSAVIIEDKDGNQWVIMPNGSVVAAPHGGLPPKYNYSDDKLDATDSLRVDFTQKLTPSPQLFGFDARRKGNTYFKWAKNFEAIRLKGGQPYFVPYQSLGAATLTATNTQTEQVIANLKYIPKSGFDASKLVFRLKDSTTPLVKTAINDSTYVVGLPAVPVGGTSGNEPCVYAYYTQGTTIKKIGKINISPLKRREEKVILVPVNGAIAPSVGVLQTYLDSVYRQANVRFTVTEKTGFRFNIDSVGAAGLARAGSGINKYSAEMRMIRDKFAIDTTYDKKASYIFVVSAFEGGGLDGFMVRGRSMGFVASGASKRTYAHELGHGAFGLEHTFPEIGQSLSNNLMDYGDSTHLTHKQCRDISKRKFVFSLLDSEEDAELKDGLVYLVNETTGVGVARTLGANTCDLFKFSNNNYIKFTPSEISRIKNLHLDEFNVLTGISDANDVKYSACYGVKKQGSVYTTSSKTAKYVNWAEIQRLAVVKSPAAIASKQLYYEEVTCDGKLSKIYSNVGTNPSYVLVYFDKNIFKCADVIGQQFNALVNGAVSCQGIASNDCMQTASTKGYDNFVITSNNQIVDFTHRVINGASSSRVTDPVIQKALAAINSINTGTSIISKVFIIDFESEVEATLKPKWTLANTEITNHISKIHASSTSKEQILVIRLPKAGSSTQMEVEFYLGGGFGNRAEIEEFFCFNKVANPSDVSADILRYTVDFLEYISSLIQKGQIPERFYNPKAPKYNNVLLQFMPPSFISGAMAQAFTSFLPAGYQIKNEEEARQMHLAFLCGIWNGGISLLADIPSGASFIIKFTNNSKLCNGSGVGFRDDLINKLKSLDKEKIKQLFAQMLAPYVNNVPMISYTVGNVTFAILSGILTAGTSTSANLITKTLKVIEKLDLLGELSGCALKGFVKLTFEPIGGLFKMKVTPNMSRMFTDIELTDLGTKIKNNIPANSNKLYVLLHSDNSGKFLIIDGNTTKLISGEELGEYFIGKKNAANGIVLLSCNDLDAAKALSKSAGVDVYTTDGPLSIETGGIKRDSGTDWYKVEANGNSTKLAPTEIKPVKDCNPCIGNGVLMGKNFTAKLNEALNLKNSGVIGPDTYDRIVAYLNNNKATNFTVDELVDKDASMVYNATTNRYNLPADIDFAMSYNASPVPALVNNINFTSIPAKQAELNQLAFDRKTSLDEAEAYKQANQMDDHAKSMQKAVKFSENIGEKAADAYMLGHFNVSPSFTGTYSNTLDKVYEVNGIYYVIEAKGGNSGLGKRSTSSGNAQQGTREYLQGTIDKMMLKTGATKQTAQLLNTALQSNNVKYLHVKQKLNIDGTIGIFIVKEFNL